MNKENRIDDVDSVIEEAIISASKTDNHCANLIIISRTLIRVKRIEKAQEILHRAFAIDRETNQHWLSHFPSYFADVGDIKTAKRVFYEIAGCGPDQHKPDHMDEILTQSARSLAFAGYIREALSYARMIYSAQSRSEVFASIADELIRGENKADARIVINEGLTTVRTISDLSYRSYITGRFGAALNAIGEVEEARKVFNEGLIIARKIEDPTERAKRLLGLFGALDKEVWRDEAAALLDELYNHARMHNLQEFIKAAEAQSKFGRRDEAERVLVQRIAILHDIVDPYAYASLIELAKEVSRLGMEDKINRALDAEFAVAHGLECVGQKIDTFKGLATIMSLVGRIEEAKILIEDAVDLSRKPEYVGRSGGLGGLLCGEPNYRTITLISLARMLIDIGKKEEARKVAFEILDRAREIDHNQRRPDILLRVAELLHSVSDAQAK